MVARKTDEYAEPLSAMCGSLRGPALHINVEKVRASTAGCLSTASNEGEGLFVAPFLCFFREATLLRPSPAQLRERASGAPRG